MDFAPHARGGRRFVAAAVLIVLFGFADPGRAATGLPPGFVDVPVVSGLTSPTAMDFAPDGRLFVTEQGGQLRVIKNGVLLATPFVTVTVSPGSERGLLGIAFDPNFASNQFVYVFYTAATPVAHNRISRFTANGDVALTGSEVVLLDFDNLSTATNHNGGALHFGPDGKLYAAHGENASPSNSQTLTNLLGKVIRMNPVPDPTAQIPTDNPFFGVATGKNQLIWIMGVRNPFTFTFQPGTGRAFVNDVGQDTWEEIDDAIAGRNYGWPITEGPFTGNPTLTNPLYAYQHHAGTPMGCAITGGAFYNPAVPTFPAPYVGKYFFADLCSGWISYIDPGSPATSTQFAAGISSPVDLKVGPDGALYYLANGNGTVGKIVMPTAPLITQQPVNRTVLFGGTTTFTVGAGGSTPLLYQWQKNGVDIPGATSASYMTPPAVAADHHSTYRCRVMNSVGTATSNSATLTFSGASRDFDGDGKTDISVFRPSTGTWYIRYTATPTSDALVWGGANDVPVPGDYDGDGLIDIAVFRPSTGTWYIRYTATATSAALVWGGAGDVAVPDDYDGDGRTDIAVFRPSTGTWYIRYSATPTSAALVWGGAGDVPQPADYDGDGLADIAVFRPSTGTWYIRYTGTPTSAALVWGGAGDVPLSVDFDGDGKAEIAVFRPSTGTWYIRYTATPTSAALVWGGGGDLPVPGDFDGDGMADIAVFRPSNGTWYIRYSATPTSAALVWGGGSDIPILKRP